MKDKRPDEDFYALGLPEKALDVTVYTPDELKEFLGFAEVKTLRDIETPGEFSMFSRTVNDMLEASLVLKGNRAELQKIFAPVDIVTADHLGFWRILYGTKKPVQCLPPKKKLTSNPHGPHYSLELRENRTVIRAKGRSFQEAEDLFDEAFANSVVDATPSSRPPGPDLHDDPRTRVLKLGAYALAPTLLQDPQFHALYDKTYQNIEDWNDFVGKFNQVVQGTRSRVHAIVSGILNMDDKSCELTPFDEQSLNEHEGLGALILKVLRSDPVLYSRYEALLFSTGEDFLARKKQGGRIRGLLTE